jgi:hypothetical protein
MIDIDDLPVSHPPSIRGADPLRVIVTIALIELSKVVAKPLHFFAIADFMSAVQKAAPTL